MSQAITIRVDMSDASRAFGALKGRGPKAMARALNRSAVTTRTVMMRAVAADMGIKVGTAREAISVMNAVPSRLVAKVEAKGARIPLIKFGAKGPTPSRGRGSGVRAKLKGGKRRYPDAFIATMRSGHTGVFQRAGAGSSRKSRGAWSKNLPIYELHGPSIAHVFGKHSKAGLDAGEAALRKNLQHEFRYALQQVGAGGS